VRMLPLHPLPHPAGDENLFAEVVSAAFAMRRKTLRNTLKAKLTEQDFQRLGINPTLRAENLSVPDFVRIVNYLHAK